MAGIPTRRILVYIAAGLVVLVVGAAGLWSLRGAGADGVVIASGGVASAASSYDPSASAPPEGSLNVSTTVATTTTNTSEAKIWVQVAGAVRRPGVYQMEPGARAFEAVLAAGGFTSDADQQSVALAAVLTDGCRIDVPRVGEAAAGQVQTPASSNAGISGGSGPAAGAGSAAAGGRVSLNTATVEELDALPGVGPSLAAQIIAYREANGPFLSVDELEEVPGIGPAKLEQLRPLVGL